MSAVRVTLDVRHPETHLCRVTVRFPASPRAVRSFFLPAWVPGSYKIRDYARNVQDLAATVAGKAVRVSHPTKDSWLVAGTRGKPVTLTYDVYAREPTVQESHITADHAHLFPPTLVLYDEASRGLAHEVDVQAPPGWRTWSGLETDALRGKLGPAVDYDHLIDCPIEVGPPELYEVRSFEVRGKTHRHVVWQPPAGVDWARLDRDMKAVVTETIKVWGEAPYAHYTFLTHITQEGGGGLEHRNSTVLGCDPANLRSDERVKGKFLPLVAHEFFHTWNVKRVLPAAFQPYDLQRETYTDLLWLFEGFTSYYELPILYRAKVLDDEAWSKLVAEDLEMYWKAVGRKRISVSQASRLTWTLLYQPHENNINRNVSYYTKGMWVGLCIDAALRQRGAKEGLDAVMRHMWRKHGKTGVGVTDDAFPDLVEQATGIDLRRQVDAWTHGTEELPIERAMRTLGWNVARDWKDPKKRLGLGIEFKPGPAPVIARIPEGMPAARILQPDDELVAAFGYKWRGDAFAELANAQKAGDAVELAVFREGRLRTVRVPLAELPKEKVTVKLRKGEASAARRKRAWLGAGVPATKGKAGTSSGKAKAVRRRKGAPAP